MSEQGTTRLAERSAQQGIDNTFAIARTPFVGREPELARVVERHRAGWRLVTLVGPPGIGKTRLAGEVVRRAQRDDPSLEVVAASLRDAPEGDAWVGAVARALGIDAELAVAACSTTIARALAGRPGAWLVLDNAERHVPWLHAHLLAWLDACPALRVLVTSRRRLVLESESLVEVEPMGWRWGAGEPPPDGLRLMLDRAQAAGVQLDLSTQGMARLAELVERLDGLPLAIVLAAHNLRWLSLRELLGRVSAAPHDLGASARDLPEIHQSLARSIAASWDALEPSHRAALVQATMFAHVFDVAAAEAVLALPDGATAREVLIELVDRSLLQRFPAEPGCFALLDSIRAFALQQATDDVLAATQLRHSRWFGARAIDLRRRRSDPDAHRELARIEPDLWAVVQRSAPSALAEAPAAEALAGAIEALCALDTAQPAGGPEALAALINLAIEAAARHQSWRTAALAVARGRLMRRWGRLRDAAAELEAAAASAAAPPDAHPDLAAVAADAYYELALVETHRGRLERAEALLVDAEARYLVAGDLGGAARSSSARARVTGRPGSMGPSAALLLRAVDLAARAADVETEALAEARLGTMRMHLDPDAAEGHLQRAWDLLAAGTPDGKPPGRRHSYLLQLRADCMAIRGRPEEALPLLDEAARIARRNGDERSVALDLPTSRGFALQLLGRFEEARAAYETASRFARDHGIDDWAGGLDALRHGVELVLGAEHEAGFAAPSVLAPPARRAREAAPAILAFGPTAREASAPPQGGRVVGARNPILSVLFDASRAARCALDQGFDDAAMQAFAASRQAVRALRERVVDRAAVSAHGPTVPLMHPVIGYPLRLTESWLDHVEAAAAAARAMPVAPSRTLGMVLEVERDGRFFRLAGRPAVDLASRAPLARVLKTLVAAHLEHPGAVLSLDRVFAGGWPDTRAQPSAKKARVQNAVSALRRMGLATVLTTQDRGYLLAPDIDVRLV